MMNVFSKIIKASKRGLTFSFKENERFKVGTLYSYVVDKKNNKVHIIPSETGELKLSRKKAGRQELPLVDLRNKEVLGLFEKADLLKITINEQDIYVEAYKEPEQSEKDSCNNVIRIENRIIEKNKIASCSIKKSILNEIRMAVGNECSYDKWLSTVAIETEYSILGKDYSTSRFDYKTGLETVYNVISLFSGAGVFDYPFALDPQFNFIYAVDKDPDACKTYRHNLGDYIECNDIHNVSGERFKNVHLVMGSPSCKPWTNVNRRLRLSEHQDSDQLAEFCRFVNECKAEMFVKENVPIVLTACNGEYYQAFKDELSDYDIDHIILTDCECGGYTIRKRLFTIGCRKGLGKVEFPQLLLKSGFKTVRDAFAKINSSWSNLDDVTTPKPDTAFRMSFVPQGGNFKDIPLQYRTSDIDRQSNTYRRLSLDEPAQTLVNWRKPPIIHPLENRILSVGEAKALQGLKGNFDILGSTLNSRQQQIGDCVPVAMGTFIKQIVKKKLNAVHGQLVFAN